jgi:exodeoxyribonuclease VII large subunit
MEFTSEIISVGQLNEAISSLINASFDTLWVRGEISNFKSYPSGHWYFKLKDADSQINAVMFKGKNFSVDFPPRDGDQVEVAAQLGFYATRGDIQLTVQQMRKAGAGALYEAFMKLKAKLESAGLFDTAQKKDIPIYPRAIGIVTSTQAAALKDVLSTLARRAGHIPVIIYPSPVQGVEAAPGMIKALAQAQKHQVVDVILLVRGGGSIEDLWSFNDEQLAYAIAQCSIPIISGVGHETDFTIADFVADLRAPTPTAAAELATPDRMELLRQVQAYAQMMSRMMHLKVEREAQRLDQLSLRMQHAIPNPEQMKLKQSQLQDRLARAWQEKLRYHRQQQAHYFLQLETLNPQRTLERGYSLILKDNQALRDAQELQTNTAYVVAMAKGTATIQLDSVEIHQDI